MIINNPSNFEFGLIFQKKSHIEGKIRYYVLAYIRKLGSRMLYPTKNCFFFLLYPRITCIIIFEEERYNNDI